MTDFHLDLHASQLVLIVKTKQKQINKQNTQETKLGTIANSLRKSEST